MGPVWFALALAATISEPQAIVSEYCVSCHNEELRIGDFSFSEIDLDQPEANAQQLEAVIRKVRAGMMPPAGMPRPDATTFATFATALEERIDEAASATPHVSAPELHRINRTEYRNAVRELLATDVDVTELLPPDATTMGFDNMSEALSITPALMSAYVRAAEAISRAAVGDPDATAGMKLYQVSRLVNQMRHVEGTPLGTRGGISRLHTFPADGEYSFHATFYHYYPGELVGIALPEQLQNQQLEVSVDGERVALIDLDPSIKEEKANYVTEKVSVKAGQRVLSAAFLSKFDGPVQDHYRLIEQTMADTTIGVTPQLTGLPHLQAFSVTGPFNARGVSESTSRRHILTCRPSAASEERACAQRILSELSRKAFRRPVTEDDVDGLMAYYDYGAEADGFDAGIRTAIQALLAKPEFIFRFESEPKEAALGTVYKISDLELASRLSYFLWSTFPDDELIEIASEGRLREPGVLESQVRRMLAHPRAEALATNFAKQWLRLTGLTNLYPDALSYPDFTQNLAVSMGREIELLFEHIMREDKDVVELLTADYTFVDEILAQHYGIPNVVGPRFKKVSLDDPNRYGLLGKAGILTVSSLANRTSPVNRGKYVLEVLVGSAPPPPPPGVPPLAESVDNERVLTVRERMERHRDNPSCSSCHRIIDPLGMALENFDAVGAWRRTDGGFTIDPTGEMYDGTPLDGPSSVRKAVVERKASFVRSFTENLFAYGLGRVVDHRDMPMVRTIQRDAAASGNRFSAFVLGIVESAPFQKRAVRPQVELETEGLDP